MMKSKNLRLLLSLLLPALLFVILRCYRLLFYLSFFVVVACSFVCHSAAQRRNLLLAVAIALSRRSTKNCHSDQSYSRLHE
jgi:hypothetical protein